MAGIGFELRRILKKDSYLNILRAYAYAGIISAGPWIISILGILVLGFVALTVVVPKFMVAQFQTSVTYLIAVSLIFSGVLQHGYTRYIADKLFIEKSEFVIPSFNGALLVMTVSSGLFASILLLTLFPNQNIIYKLEMIASFVILCNIWTSTSLLSGLQSYRTILVVFAIGYVTVVLSGILLQPFGLEGLLAGILIGHFVLLAGIIIAIYAGFPLKGPLVSLEFMRHGQMFPALIFTGFFYNLAIWADKFVFWANPPTSTHVIGPLTNSPIYDLPIFIAYLSIIPGMAVFLVRMETDFVEFYHRFYNAVLHGASLSFIREMRNEMVVSARHGIFDIIKIQSIAIFIIFILAPKILQWIGISQAFLYLFYIDLVGVGLQVVFLGLLNVFFYLDKRGRALFLTAGFFVLNTIFTIITIKLGAFYYGYGFTLSLLVMIVIAMHLLEKDFDSLEYQTFMMQKMYG